MIDKLLQRIANRQQADSNEHALASHTSGLNKSSGGRKPISSNPRSSSQSSAPPSDPFAEPFSAIFASSYPAARHTRKFTDSSINHSDDAWLQAAQTYMEQRVHGRGMPDQPAFFAHWTVAHMAVAQLLWCEREHLHQGFIEIRCASALFAVVYPQQSLVLLRPEIYDHATHAALLTLEQFPTNHHAPASETYKGFASTQLHTLLWFMGQAYAGAPQLLPENLGSHELQLRRFPYIEPAAMDVRHLSLMHLFSSGALSFARLQTLVAQEHADSLCADICSLYFTGALHLISPKQ